MSSSPEFEEKRTKPEEALEPAAQRRAEDSLGLDLSGVRLHRDAEGARVSAAEEALAVTRGQQLYFAPQAQPPGTPEGERLLAHELAHVAQSVSSGAAASRSELEAEADQTAEAIASGRRAPVQLRADPGVVLKQEDPTPASIAQHNVEITPLPPSGTVMGGGLSIPYVYTSTASSLAALTLQVPEGVAVVVTPLNAEAAEHQVQNSEGNRSRAVVVSMHAQLARRPRVQLAFTRGSSTYVVVFLFPYDDAPTGPASAAAEGSKT
jgi:hypothetical protein